MAYIGNTPGENFISFSKQVFTIVNSQTAYSLDHKVTDENELRLVINNVVQEPGTGKAYTASGNTLTIASALTNGTAEMYCIFLGKARETVTLLPYFRPRGPLTWLDPGAFGTLGVGGGFALGAKLCRPDSEVWIIYGDGSLGYSVAEFDTFTRHKVGLFCSIHLFPQSLPAMC